MPVGKTKTKKAAVVKKTKVTKKPAPKKKSSPAAKVVSRTKPKTKAPVKKKPIIKSPGVIKKLKPKKKDTITDSFKKGEKKPFSFPQSVALAVIAAPRLPLDVDALAVGLARYSGLSFVVVGAIMTMFFAQQIGLTGPIVKSTGTWANEMKAQLVGSTDEVLRTAENDSTNTLSVEKPPVKFNMPEKQPITGVLKVTLAVDRAEAVSILGFHKETAQKVNLGFASKVDEKTWGLDWKTVNFPDGQYRLKAIIKNATGSYDASAEDYIVIKNTISDTDSSTITTTEQTITENTLVSKIDIQFDTLNEKEVLINLRPDQDPESIVVKAANRSSGDLREVGRAVKKSDLRWVLQLDTTNFAPGLYAFFAVASQKDKIFTSRKFDLQIGEKLDTNIVEETALDINDDEDKALVPTEVPKESTSENTTKIELNAKQSGLAAVKIFSPGASFIEVYIRSKSAQVTKFIGLANRKSDHEWSFLWNTVDLPNGEYFLITKAKTNAGTISGTSAQITIFNEDKVLSDSTQFAESGATRIAIKETAIETARKISEVEKEFPETFRIKSTATATSSNFRKIDEETFKEELIQSKIFSENEVPEELTLDDSDQVAVDKEIDDIFKAYRTEIDSVIQYLASAIRTDDTAGIAQAKRRLTDLRGEIIRAHLEGKKSDELITFIDNKLERQLAKRTLQTEKSERIIKERVGENASKDSDNDGISDFDEVNLYKTDPLVADTDGDGFLDSLEILGGYNPNDSSPEATVAFESPREAGVVRSDILRVDAITKVTADKDDDQSDGVELEAVISGKGLPNSFVTLYIFSNPIVVTVKTDAEGNWSYFFDKEIEDGTHEIYVGVTDNAGRVVAKSEPIQFVKTAQAFTPVDAATNQDSVSEITIQDDQSILSPFMLLLVASISIVSIGLVLILLGLHLRAGRKEESLIEEANTSI